MTTRRELFLGALLALTAAWAPSLPEPAGPLQVTYFYLPG
jgi:hypothetical protein